MESSKEGNQILARFDEYVISLQEDYLGIHEWTTKKIFEVQKEIIKLQAIEAKNYEHNQKVTKIIDKLKDIAAWKHEHGTSPRNMSKKVVEEI